MWHYIKDGAKHGPVSREQLAQRIKEGGLTENDLVWTPGMAQWAKAGETPGVYLPPEPATAIESRVPADNPALDVDEPANAQPSPVGTAELHPARLRSLPTEPAGNYFARHWRGELPLWISYWVNGILVTVLAAVTATMVGELDVQAHPALFSWTAAAFLLGVLPAGSVWQLVGIWRSARKHPGGWATVAQFMVVFGVLSSLGQFNLTLLPAGREFLRIATGNDAAQGYTVQVLRDGTELEVAGPIGFGLTDRVREELDAHPSIALVHLNSIGGRVTEARALATLIEARHLKTYTATGCASACVLAYAAGSERLIDENAQLGFHQYAFPGFSSANFRAQYAQDKAYLRSRGVTQSFVDRAFATDNSTLWKPSHAELYAAHFITAQAGADSVAVSGMAPAQSQQAFDTDLAKIPLYAVLKDTDPTLYASFAAELQEALAKGHSVAELRAKMQPRLVALRNERMPYASDKAIVAFSALMLEEWKTLQRKDPTLCYGYVVGTNLKVMEAALAVLPAELTSRESDALAQIIRTGKDRQFGPPAPATAEASLQEVAGRLRAQYGEDVLVLANLEAPDIDRTKACAMAIAMYTKLVTLPESEGGPVLRYMASQMK